MNTTATPRRLCLHHGLATEPNGHRTTYVCVEPIGHAGRYHRSLHGVLWASGFPPARTHVERFDLETELDLRELGVPEDYQAGYRAQRRASVGRTVAQLADGWERAGAGLVGAGVKLLERLP